MKVQSKINELFQNPNTVFIFDVDGVLAPIEYGEYNHYYYDDEKWAEMILKEDLYENVAPIKRMQEFLKTKDKSRVFVVTKVMNEVELEQKKRFLKKHYHIFPEHVFMVLKDVEKLDKIHEIKPLFPNLEDKFFVMIDDTVNILSCIMEKSGYSTVHISSFLD